MTRRCRWLALATIAAVVVGLGLGTARPTTARQEKEKSGGRTAVPFEMLPSNHMVVSARINGKGPYRLIFDLGAPVTLLGSKAAEAAGVIKPDAPRAFLLGARGEAVVDRLELGNLEAKKVPVIVMDHPALKVLNGMLRRPVEGIVGYTFFAHYRTTIDYQASELTFTPVEFRVRDLMKDLPARLTGPKVARTIHLAPRGLWGLVLGEPKGGISSIGVPIREVRPGSPAAEAGLQAGDVLTSLDGRWTTTIPDTFAAAATVPPGRAVDVDVVRDGRARTVKVAPRDGI